MKIRCRWQAFARKSFRPWIVAALLAAVWAGGPAGAAPEAFSEFADWIRGKLDAVPGARAACGRGGGVDVTGCLAGIERDIVDEILKVKQDQGLSYDTRDLERTLKLRVIDRSAAVILMDLGRGYEAAGDRRNAGRIYRRIVDTFGSQPVLEFNIEIGEIVENARRSLSRVNAASP